MDGTKWDEFQKYEIFTNRFPQDGKRVNCSFKNVAHAVRSLVRINLLLLEKRPVVKVWYATGESQS